MSRVENFRLRPWPFEENEIVTLMWVSSPYMSGSQKQWKLRVVFVSGSGMAKEVHLAWGALPLLVTGQRYRDGRSIEGSFENVISRINLSSSRSLGWMNTKEVLPEYLWRLSGVQDWDEQCWVWEYKGTARTRYILPALTVIRVFHTHGNFLTQGILDPLTLDNLGVSEISQDILKIRFNRHISLPVIPDERVRWIRRVARLLCDSSFGDSYRSVALQKSENPAVPIICDPPNVKADWKVRVKRPSGTKNVLYIQDIVETTPVSELPINLIEYEHPNYLKRTLQVRSRTDKKGGDRPSRLIIDGESEASKLPRRKNLISVPSGGLREETALKVRNVGHSEDTKEMPLVQQQGGEERIVSLARPGPNPDAPLAEVRPRRGDSGLYEPSDESWVLLDDWAVPQGDGLDGLREMLVALSEMHPQVDIIFHLGPKRLSGSRRLLDRPYAVVGLSKGSQQLWLIEFANRPERPLSTLAIRGANCNSWSAFEPVLFQVLAQGLSLQRGWIIASLTEISSLSGFFLRRLPHSASGPKKWAERVVALLPQPSLH